MPEQLYSPETLITDSLFLAKKQSLKLPLASLPVRKLADNVFLEFLLTAFLHSLVLPSSLVHFIACILSDLGLVIW